MPISIYEKMDKFTNNEFQLIKDDRLYLFTDGFADQFGGEFCKKFKYKPFQELLVSLAEIPMEEQKEKINIIFNDWKKDAEQTDDVLVIGLKI
jgi:serine phosphatase RsbU (regulator of sigma subunit)